MRAVYGRLSARMGGEMERFLFYVICSTHQQLHYHTAHRVCTCCFTYVHMFTYNACTSSSIRIDVLRIRVLFRVTRICPLHYFVTRESQFINMLNRRCDTTAATYTIAAVSRVLCVDDHVRVLVNGVTRSNYFSAPIQATTCITHTPSHTPCHTHTRTHVLLNITVQHDHRRCNCCNSSPIVAHHHRIHVTIVTHCVRIITTITIVLTTLTTIDPPSSPSSHRTPASLIRSPHTASPPCHRPSSSPSSSTTHHQSHHTHQHHTQRRSYQ